MNLIFFGLHFTVTNLNIVFDPHTVVWKSLTKIHWTEICYLCLKNKLASETHSDFFHRYFIGTSVSTFSFRIHEEREILGFDPKTTYNRFCGEKEKNCEQPTHWKIVY